jgi:hypothetical protein
MRRTAWDAETASYRGHLMTYHGGDLPGFHTQVSFMPQDHVGVIVFEIGNHTQPLYNIVTYNVYERLLGMDLTPWSDRQLEIRLKTRKPEPKRGRKPTKGAFRIRNPLTLWPITAAFMRTPLTASWPSRSRTTSCISTFTR